MWHSNKKKHRSSVLPPSCVPPLLPNQPDDGGGAGAGAGEAEAASQTIHPPSLSTAQRDGVPDFKTTYNSFICMRKIE